MTDQHGDGELTEPAKGRLTDREWPVDAMWDRVQRQTSRSLRIPRGRPVHRPRVRAGYLLGVGGAIAAASYFAIATPSSEVPQPTVPVAREYATGVGERATIRLGDGSVITLAPGSKLTVAGDYGDSSRTITLAGQASFEVQHDATKPFRVHAGNARVEDIGTRFDVRAYAREAVTVGVSEGEVELTAADSRPLRLTAGQAGRVSNAGVVTAAPMPTQIAAWQAGRLVFTNEPVGEVLRALGRWYDFDITVDSALGERRVTTEFAADRPTEMIDALAAALGARVERSGKTVTLKGGDR